MTGGRPRRSKTGLPMALALLAALIIALGSVSSGYAAKRPPPTPTPPW